MLGLSTGETSPARLAERLIADAIQAWQGLSWMAREGVQPGLLDFEGLIRSCCQAGLLGDAQVAVQEMRALQISLRISSYAPIFEVYHRGALGQKALQDLKTIKADGLQPDSSLYSAAALAAAGLTQASWVVKEILRMSISDGAPVDLLTYGKIVSSNVLALDEEPVWDMALAQMGQRDMKQATFSFFETLTIMSKLHVTEVIEKVHQARSFGWQPSNTCLITLYQKVQDLNLNTFQVLQGLGFQCNHRRWSAMAATIFDYNDRQALRRSIPTATSHTIRLLYIDQEDALDYVVDNFASAFLTLASIDRRGAEQAAQSDEEHPGLSQAYQMAKAFEVVMRNATNPSRYTEPIGQEVINYVAKDCASLFLELADTDRESAEKVADTMWEVLLLAANHRWSILGESRNLVRRAAQGRGWRGPLPAVDP